MPKGGFDFAEAPQVDWQGPSWFDVGVGSESQGEMGAKPESTDLDQINRAAFISTGSNERQK